MKVRLNKVFLLLLLCFGITFNSLSYSIKGETKEVKIYHVSHSYAHCILSMGYASHQIQNPDIWKSQNKTIKSIDIVFTAYPKNKDEWITNYDWLLNKRIEAIQLLDPGIAKNPLIKWNFILQTDCKNEEDAQRLFHGIVINYQLIKPIPVAQKQFAIQKTAELEVIYNEIEAVTYGMNTIQDSVVFKVFERNKWNNMLIVNDWTGSMYQYGAQTVLWHRLNFDKNAVKYFIFFNDGNNKLDRQKRNGNTGGIYYCKPDNIDYLIKVMKLVAKRGNGGDIPENNIEVLLKATRLFKDFDELVMIADNNAGVRDLMLLDRVNVPIRIILCGTSNGEPIHPHYLEIARKTGGSIHTINEDITGLNALKEGQKMSIAGTQYYVKRGKMSLLKTRR